MPTAATIVNTTAGSHQPHGPTTANGSNTPARAVDNATKPNRINAARLPRQNVHRERSVRAKYRAGSQTPSVVDSKAANQPDLVPIRVGKPRRPVHVQRIR